MILSYFIPFLVPNLNNLKWIGPKPHKSLWKMFWLKNKTHLTKGEFKHLNYVDLLYFGGTNYSFKDGQLYYRRDVQQSVTQNSKDENRLLELSMGPFFPHEVYRVQVETNIGTIIKSKVFHKNMTKGPGAIELLKEIFRLESEVKRINLRIKSIHIIHTHPSLEIGVKKDGKWRFFLNGLSKADLLLGEFLSKRLKKEIFIKAITPNGVNYSYTFRN